MKIWPPPIPSKGMIAIARTIKPIPPSHCKSCLYRSNDLGSSSKPVITVAPVVVIPDIDSKNESIGAIPNSKNGIDPTLANISQKNVITKNPSLA